MAGNAADSVDAIAQAIEHYLVAHPDAADSVTGIQKWWLPAGLHDCTEETVQRAVERLETQDLLMRSALAGGAIVYSRKRVARGTLKLNKARGPDHSH
jgi:hypothetical protein